MGSYKGPLLVPPQLPEKMPPNFTTTDVKYLVRNEFEKDIVKKTTELNAKLSKSDPQNYNIFLAALKNTAISCVDSLTPELKEKLKTFSFSYNFKQRDSTVRAVSKTVSITDACVDAVFSLVDKNGIFIGGAITGQTVVGQLKRKATIFNPGILFILEPQVLQAWPGRDDAPTLVLDPRDGPFRVALAHTFEKEIKTHSQAFKQKNTVDVETYLNFTNNGHFLIVDEFGDAMGWIDMDKAAFFDQSMIREGFISRDSYIYGVAAKAHGAFWDHSGERDRSAKKDECVYLLAPIWVNNYLSLVSLKVQPKPCTNMAKTHPKTMQIYQLRNVVGLFQKETSVIKYKCDMRIEWRRPSKRKWKVENIHGTIDRDSYYKPYYNIDSLFEKINLADIYQKRGVTLDIKPKTSYYLKALPSASIKPVALAPTPPADLSQLTYKGPILPQPKIIAPLAEPKKTLVSKLLQYWFTDQIDTENRRLITRYKFNDIKKYNDFLAKQKHLSNTCSKKLSDELQNLLEKYQLAKTFTERDPILRQVQKIATEQDDAADCVEAAFALINQDGILLGGATIGQTLKGEQKQKPTIYNPGFVHIIKSQMLYAWPGRDDAPVRVLDPRDGPFNVALAHTFADTVTMHGDKWKSEAETNLVSPPVINGKVILPDGKWESETTINIDKYKNYTRNDHFLLVDKNEKPLGWINMDSVAFWDKRHDYYMNESTEMYTSGAALMIHGFMWVPEGTCDKGQIFYPRCRVPQMHTILGNDMLSQVMFDTKFDKNISFRSTPPKTVLFARIAEAGIYETNNSDVQHIGISYRPCMKDDFCVHGLPKLRGYIKADRYNKPYYSSDGGSSAHYRHTFEQIYGE
ncbi:MAG: hypothetical protein JW841_15290 [Deltaproteobacteria bacterium]|nr:hypothetical protein [Deltaproteobacteria bacterium]